MARSELECEKCGAYPILSFERKTHVCPPIWEILYADGEARGEVRTLEPQDAATEYVRLHHVDFDYAMEVECVRVRMKGSELVLSSR